MLHRIDREKYKDVLEMLVSFDKIKFNRPELEKITLKTMYEISIEAANTNGSN
jgi:hypothetical protein